MSLWSTNNWQYGLGVVWAVIGVLGIVVFAALSFIVPIPKLADLKVSETVVTGDIEIHRPSKAPAFLILPTQEGVKKIHNICFVWDCACDCGASVSRLPLRQGDHIRIWARDEQLWQLSTGHTLILAYESAVEGERSFQKRCFALSIGVFVLGAMLAFWGVSRERSNRALHGTRQKPTRP